MFLTSVLSVVTAFVERGTPPAPYLYGAAACGAVVMGTTLISELPKHMKLDKDGKDDALVEGLIRDNIPRTLAWTVGCVLLVLAGR